jgi:1-deoxy-D-xylulose-5-phosphate reductoisomerase
VDGSLKAQLGVPDMRLPILYALTYPDRVPSDLVETSIDSMSSLTFEKVNRDDLPCLRLAYEALERGGTAPAAISAADEIAVDAFLNHRIRFTDIATVVSDVLKNWPDEPLTDIPGVRAADRNARAMAVDCVLRVATAERSRLCC